MELTLKKFIFFILAIVIILAIYFYNNPDVYQKFKNYLGLETNIATSSLQNDQATTDTGSNTPVGVPGLSKKIRIATEGAYPPFNYVDQTGELKGFDVDIAKALCEKMKADCEIVAQDWDGIIPGLQAKKYDAIIASMSITPQRKEQVDFSKKYYQTPARFVKKKDTDITISNDGLANKRVAVQRATIHENFIKDQFPKAIPVLYDTQDNANLDMVAGRVDLLFADSVVLNLGFLKTESGKDYEFVGPSYVEPKSILGEGVGIALRKGETDLLNSFNQAIDAIREDDTYKKINDTYFDFDVYGD
ncbi:MAG: ABC transporter substrate-binding protein [Alphaproteobacteria bacterium]|nr:ABC transporter substrate-binding protein [Alphaproteobacteria bacterium]